MTFYKDSNFGYEFFMNGLVRARDLFGKICDVYSEVFMIDSGFYDKRISRKNNSNSNKCGKLEDKL